MSAVKKTGTTSKTWQAGWTYTDSAGGEGASLIAFYEDNLSGWQSRLPAVSSAAPAELGSEFAAFKVARRKVLEMEGEKVRVEVVFNAGFRVDQNPAEDDPVPRYSMAVSLGDEPILTHERYESLPDNEREALRQILSGEKYKTEEGKEEWEAEIESAPGLEVLAKIKKGVSAHREPGLIWRERKRILFSQLNSESQLDKVRRIDTPPGSPPGGGNRDYMYLGPQLDQDETGEFADLVREWELSGPEGWDPDLYGDQGGGA